MSDKSDSSDLGGLIIVTGIALVVLLIIGALSGGGSQPKVATALPEPEPPPPTPPPPQPAPPPMQVADTGEPEQQYCDRCEIWYTESSCPGYYCSTAYQDWLDDDADGSGDGSG